MTTVSVVIPLHNHAATILEAIESVLAQTALADGVTIEIVIVDDASTDGGAALVTGLPVNVVRNDRRRGAAFSRNLGFERSTGEFVMFLDSDDLIPPNRLRQQLAALDARPEAGLASGKLDEFADSGYTPRRRLMRGVTTNMVGALLLRRSTFELVGGFDETFSRREVVEWGARLRRSGAVSTPVEEVVLLRRLHAHNHGNDGAQATQLLSAVRSHLLAREVAHGAADAG